MHCGRGCADVNVLLFSVCICNSTIEQVIVHSNDGKLHVFGINKLRCPVPCLIVPLRFTFLVAVRLGYG